MEYRETQVRLGQDTDRRYTKRNIQHRNPPNKRGGGGWTKLLANGNQFLFVSYGMSCSRTGKSNICLVRARE